MRELPPIIKRLIDEKLLTQEDALGFCTYNLWHETCSCGAVIVPLESDQGSYRPGHQVDGWADLQGFTQNGTHTHAPIASAQVQVATHGLSFSPDLARVVLIHNVTKDPTLPWHDTLMGLGGKLEGNESPLDCMIREYREESGVLTKPDDWVQYCVLNGSNGKAPFKVHCFYNVGESYRLVRSAELEKHVKAYHVRNLYGGLNEMMYGQCRWLMEMALSLANEQEKRASGFEINEVYQ